MSYHLWNNNLKNKTNKVGNDCIGFLPYLKNLKTFFLLTFVVVKLKTRGTFLQLLSFICSDFNMVGSSACKKKAASATENSGDFFSTLVSCQIISACVLMLSLLAVSIIFRIIGTRILFGSAYFRIDSVSVSFASDLCSDVIH